jgi:hypothetical protein
LIAVQKFIFLYANETETQNYYTMKATQRIIWILLGLFLVVPHTQLLAQMPQGFKYQTVVRNSAGLAIANQTIKFRLSILAGSAQGTAVYVETQTEQTSPLGIVSLMAGTGTASTGNFNQINWSAGNYYLQIELDPNGGTNYSLMGTSQLVSVPYALYAQSSGAGQWSGDSKSIYYNGWVGINGAVKQDTTSNDTILFEVKDKKGKPVFRVLESGVRIYVESGSKGSKGGFAVGGRSEVKGGPADLMWITNDSIRLYVDDPGTKGSKGGFAVGGRSPGGKGDAVNFIHLTPLNYFIGQESGINNTTGSENTFLGYQAGYSNTEGSTDIFIGKQSGYNNIDGIDNVFIGNTGGFNNISGFFNIFIGRASGYENTLGYSNIFIGDGSGGSNTEGQNNVYVGDYSGHLNDLGSQNVYLGAYAGSSATADTNIFVGYSAGYANGTGNNNIFIGSESGENNVSGRDNIFIGTNTGIVNESGFENVFIGNEAGTSNTTGTYNNLVGKGSGKNITEGNLNNFLGDESGRETTTGNSNLFLGDWSGRDNVDGSENVYLGANAGILNSSGSGNIFLGFSAGHDETASNKLYIANSNADNTHALIYGEFDNKILRVNGNMGINSTGFSGYGLVVGVPAGQTVVYALGIYGSAYATGSFISASDRRLKRNIVNLPNTLEKTLSLRPVTFDWIDPEQSKTQGKQIGFIAQEVEELFPELVKTDATGLKAMDYSKLSVIIIQAFKEQQQIITKQQSDLDQQQKSINVLNDENKAMKLQLQKLNEMQSELEKIKARLENPVKK